VTDRPRTRLLGVDFGSVRIGLAVCDADRIIASPLEIRERKGDVADAAYFRQVVEREQIGGLVVGLPVHTDGRIGVKAKEAQAFGTWLAGVTGLPVVYADERFSTAFAESALWAAGLTHKKRKQRRDAVAAQVMLQAYIEAGCPTEVGGALDGPAED
jgi:putative holliday junction resolvase